MEFFRGTDTGKNVREVLRRERCYSSVVSLAELVEWCLRNDLKARIRDYVTAVAGGSVVLNLDEEIAAIAGRINHERKKKMKEWGMMDSMILATAISYNLSIFTGDSHFKDLPNVEVL